MKRSLRWEEVCFDQQGKGARGTELLDFLFINFPNGRRGHSGGIEREPLTGSVPSWQFGAAGIVRTNGCCLLVPVASLLRSLRWDKQEGAVDWQRAFMAVWGCC